MSLDQNLFTLTFQANEEDATVTDLIDSAGVLHYHKQRVSGVAEYRMNVYDPISGALLSSATAPSASSKAKTIELYHPDTAIELRFVGTLSFRWAFKWEEHDFEWKKEECFMLRKPDPPVLVAVTKEARGNKASTVQLLDYNLNRFDVYDRKGLELVILTALLSFRDQSEESSEPTAPRRGSSARANSASATAPVPPPKPAPKTGVERVKELHAIRRDAVNEVTIEEEGPVEDWAQFCVNLLLDDDMLFISVRSDTATQVPKVLQVVEESKRKRHKLGVAYEQELFQYVVYDASTPAKGPRVIKLDEPRGAGKDAYAPPQSLTVHLSKIPMPELQPNVDAAAAGSSSFAGPKSPTRRQASVPPTPPKTSKISHTKTASAGGAKLSKPQAAPQSSGLGVPSHQVHPHQPSPSPSQLNNPMVYVAPPPDPRFGQHGPRPPPHLAAKLSSWFNSLQNNIPPPPAPPGVGPSAPVPTPPGGSNSGSPTRPGLLNKLSNLRM